MSEKSNYVVPLEAIYPTLITLPDPNSQTTVLPTNQVPWITYYRRNLIKEVWSPVVQPAPIQDSATLRDQGMINSIDSHINNRMSENDRFETNYNNAHTYSKVGENDRFETNYNNAHTYSKVGENDVSENNGSKIVSSKDMDEKGSVDEIITNREDRIDENEVVA